MTMISTTKLRIRYAECVKFRTKAKRAIKDNALLREQLLAAHKTIARLRKDSKQA